MAQQMKSTKKTGSQSGPTSNKPSDEAVVEGFAHPKQLFERFKDDKTSFSHYYAPVLSQPLESSPLADQNSATTIRKFLQVVKFTKALHRPATGFKNKEIAMLQKISGHPNIQKLASFDQENMIWFTTSAVSTLTLEALTDHHRRRNDLVSEGFIWSFLRQSASALAFLHFGTKPDHRRGDVTRARHEPMTHNLFSADNILIVPASAASHAAAAAAEPPHVVYPAMVLTNFSGARTHPYRKGADAKSIVEAKYDMSNLACVAHFAIHMAQYSDDKDRATDSYCVCFTQGGCAWALKEDFYSAELMGILNACADPDDKCQFSSKLLLEHLPESLVANKMQNAWPVEDWTVGSYLAPQAQMMEMMDRSIFDIPGIEDVDVSAIVEDEDAHVEQMDDGEDPMEIDDDEGEDDEEEEGKDVRMFLDVEAEEASESEEEDEDSEDEEYYESDDVDVVDDQAEEDDENFVDSD